MLTTVGQRLMLAASGKWMWVLGQMLLLYSHDFLSIQMLAGQIVSTYQLLS